MCILLYIIQLSYYIITILYCYYIILLSDFIIQTTNQPSTQTICGIIFYQQSLETDMGMSRR